MGQSSFAKRASAQEAGASRRRSTRIDYVCAVVVSGRDATGETFREETETSTVNLHGCRLSTSHEVLLGMQVTVECPATGLPEKAICVHKWETPPGKTTHDIAVQLLKPQNLWGLKNPPADWETVAESMVRGRPTQPQREAPGVVVPERPGPPPAAASSAPMGLADLPVADLQLAQLEQRSAQLMESVLQIIRTQTDQIVRDTLETFRQQLEVLITDAQERVHKRAEQSYEEVESTLNALRLDLAEQLSQRTDQIVQAAEEALRAKVGEMFATMLKPGTGKPHETPPEK